MSRNDDHSDDRDDDKPKIDWRELDRRRDRSQHRTGAAKERSAKEEALRSPAVVERYKKQLDQLFSGPTVKKLGVEEQEQLKKIRAARGPAINSACHAYLKQFGGPPGDWESLLLFLDASDPQILQPVLELCERLYGEQTPSRQTNFKQQLRILSMMGLSADLRLKVETLSKKMN